MSIITSKLSKIENISQKKLSEGINKGSIVVLKNKNRKIKPLAIGKGLSVKINTNIGTSTDSYDPKYELKKLNAALEAKADTIMDLSVGGDIRKTRKVILANSPIPVGTVPIYEAAIKAKKKFGDFSEMTPELILETIEEQAKDGIDFFTIHAGIDKNTVKRLQSKKRYGGVVSRGGAILVRWIIENQKENPLITYFPQILDIAKKYNIALSLGDGMRPGALSDSLDYFQIKELINLGKLVKLAKKKGVQVIIEGPGHVPINQIELNVKLQKELCYDTPFYILGPLVLDSALGFDHITSAIGSSIAAMHGADFICVVTPKEHLGQPNPQDIKQGTIAAKIAAHAVNILKNKTLRQQENLLSKARRKRDWDNHIARSLFPREAKKLTKGLKLSDVCTMCGNYCSLKIIDSCDLS